MNVFVLHKMYYSSYEIRGFVFFGWQKFAVFIFVYWMGIARFVVSKSSNAVKPACTTCTGFFIALFLVLTAPHIDGAVPFVKGLKTFTRCLGWIHGKGGTVFCCPSSHKISNKAMRTSQTIQALQERVSSTQNLLQTKETVNEIFGTYFISELFAGADEEGRADSVFLLRLFQELLDELYLNQSKKGGVSCRS